MGGSKARPKVSVDGHGTVTTRVHARLTVVTFSDGVVWVVRRPGGMFLLEIQPEDVPAFYEAVGWSMVQRMATERGASPGSACPGNLPPPTEGPSPTPADG